MTPPRSRCGLADVPARGPALQTSTKAFDERAVRVDLRVLVERELPRPVPAREPEHDDAALVDPKTRAPVLDREHEVITLASDAPVRVLLRSELQHLHDRVTQGDTEPLLEEAELLGGELGELHPVGLD